MDCEIDFPVVRADKRYFVLTTPASPVKEYRGIVSTVKIEDGVLVVTLSSILQVPNTNI